MWSGPAERLKSSGSGSGRGRGGIGSGSGHGVESFNLPNEAFNLPNDADNTAVTDIDDIDSSSSFTPMSLSPIASSDFKTTDFRFRFQISFWLER